MASARCPLTRRRLRTDRQVRVGGSSADCSGCVSKRYGGPLSNNSMQRTALRAAADAER